VIRLNPDQNIAMVKVLDFIENPNQRAFGLYGYAGTGKTTTICQALRGQDQVCLSAPTHKAVAVLSGMSSDNAFACSTIHSLLGCKKLTVEGNTTYQPDLSRPQRIKNYSIIVIDECSMIGEDLYGWIDDATRNTRIKIIYMGDPLQLPPVGDVKLSPAISIPGHKLEKIMRNQGAVQKAATDVRLNIKSRSPALPRDAECADGIVKNYNDRNQWLTDILDDLDRCKVLAYTNMSVDSVNKWIRTQLFGDNASPFEVGERLVVKSTHEAAGATLHTETEIIVKTKYEANHLGLDCWRLGVMVKDTSLSLEIFAMDDAQKKPYKEALIRAKKNAQETKKWEKYNELSESFCGVRPGWATTIHKSQGSTYEHVYVDQTDVLSAASKDFDLRNRLLYVAYSRAKKGLFII
jgi:exodeoxyribonuclease V